MASIDELAREISRQLAFYSQFTEQQLLEAAENTAKEAVNKLKTTSPDRTGDYAKSWTYRKVGNNFIVFNRRRYRLTHLLEKSHALRDGGRSTPEIHIKPAEEEANRRMQNDILSRLST